MNDTAFVFREREGMFFWQKENLISFGNGLKFRVLDHKEEVAAAHAVNKVGHHFFFIWANERVEPIFLIFVQLNISVFCRLNDGKSVIDEFIEKVYKSLGLPDIDMLQSEDETFVAVEEQIFSQEINYN